MSIFIKNFLPIVPKHAANAILHVTDFEPASKFGNPNRLILAVSNAAAENSPDKKTPEN